MAGVTTVCPGEKESKKIARYNVAVVGQTGAGKSSFINYLYGKEIARADVGRPVTAKGFHEYEFELNNLPVTLFDSWGLEVGKQSEWMEQLEGELKKRGIDSPAQEWFHSVFYCISAASARVQSCDIEIIKKFIQNKYQVSVILTKADLLPIDDKEKLIAAIQDQVAVEIISVCSIESKTRAGYSQPFGNMEVRKKVFIDFYNSLIERLPSHCQSVMSKYLDKRIGNISKGIEDRVGFMANKSSEVGAEIDAECGKIYREIPEAGKDSFENTIKLYGEFLKGLEYPPIDAGDLPKVVFDSREPSQEMGYGEIALAAITAPLWFLPGFAYQAFKGKDDDVKKLRGNLYRHKDRMSDGIVMVSERVKKVLQDAKVSAQRGLQLSDKD